MTGYLANAKNFRCQLDRLESDADSELRPRFRFGREAIQYIVNLAAYEITSQTDRNNAVSAVMQVLVGFVSAGDRRYFSRI